MLDIIKSYFKDKKYYVVMYNDGLLVKNYTKVYNVSDNLLILSLEDKNITIKGDSFLVSEINNSEISISGNIESIEIK